MNPDGLLAVYRRVVDAPDAIARVRRFVLELAVRGKLVAQDPADESAADLLRRIASERARLRAAGKIRRPRSIVLLDPADIPFSLPAGWQWTQMSHLGVISPRNEAPDGQRASFVPMPLISAKYGANSEHELRLWGQIKKGYTHFAEGDVGLAKITPCFENGKSTVFRNLTGGFGSGTTELHVVRPLFVSADYIVLFLKSQYFIETGISRMTGTAGQKRVPTDYFTSSPFPLPPLAEQHRIVDKVDELMAVCDRLEEARRIREKTRDKLSKASVVRLIEPNREVVVSRARARSVVDMFPALTARTRQIKHLRATILNLAVEGRLVAQDLADERASDSLIRISAQRARLTRAKRIRRLDLDPIGLDEPPFEIPTSWCWTRLGNIGDWGSGSTPRRGYPDFYGGNITWLKSGELNDNSRLIGSKETLTSLAIAKGSFRMNQPGDVLMAMYGATIGKVAILAESAVTNQAVCGCTPFDGVLNRFLFLFLVSEREKLRGSSEGGAQPNISKAKIVRTPFPLPPLAEQHRIVAKVDELMAMCNRLEAGLGAIDLARGHLLDSVLREAVDTEGE